MHEEILPKTQRDLPDDHWSSHCACVPVSDLLDAGFLVLDKFGNLRQSSYPVSAGILFRELFRPVPGRGIFELF